MGVRFPDDAVASFRLARSEWWLAVDLVAGLAGYVVWVAGSAALGLQLASLADYPLAPDGTPTTPVLGLVALLWLVLPGAVGVARVRSRLRNIRGNIEQDYRLDRPAALLVPPGLLVAILLVAVVAMGTAPVLPLVVLVPATLYLLVRTLAFSYRVFSFSRPSLLYAGLFATLAVQAGVLLAYLGEATENGATVTAAVDALGLPVDPLATVEIAVLSVPAGLAAAVALPVGLVAAYVLAQSGAALLVRVRNPTVRPSRVRTGQRYPPGLDVASNARRTTSSKANSGTGTPGSSASTSGGSPSGASTSNAGASNSGSSSAAATASTGTGSSGGTADSTAADAATADGTASEDDTAAGSGTAGDESTETDVADEEAESVSNTRVFTPPGGADDPLSASSLDDGADCPDCGATVPAEADRCPACGADAP